MMDEVKGLSAGAAVRADKAACRALRRVDGVRVGRLLRAVAVGSDFGLGIRRSLCGGIPCAWPDVGDVRGSDGGSGCQWLSFPDIHGVGRAVYFWTEMFANLCFSLACSVVMTLGFVLTPEP